MFYNYLHLVYNQIVYTYNIYKTESEIEDQKYESIVKKFDMKQKNGKPITEADVLEVIQGMKELHDSVEIHKEAVIAENKANSFKG